MANNTEDTKLRENDPLYELVDESLPTYECQQPNYIKQIRKKAYSRGFSTARTIYEDDSLYPKRQQELELHYEELIKNARIEGEVNGLMWAFGDGNGFKDSDISDIVYERIGKLRKRLGKGLSNE